MFLDHVTLHIEAGHGGAGGSVHVRATRALNTLNPFRNVRSFAAGRGAPGEGCLRHGKDGADVLIEVPRGTVIRDAQSGEVLAELMEDGQKVCVARGGRGGLGNNNFKSATNRTPRHTQPGEDGEIREVEFELKLIADVGLAGFPNAGKSTLVSRISAARPKIADYPFTTLEPQLGVVAMEAFGGDDRDSFVIADIPGLIEGASQGAGLGIQFLRHVERTRMLLHLVDLADPVQEPEEAIAVIEGELKAFSEVLFAKPRWLVATKLDALQDEDRRHRFEALCRERGQEPIFISGVTGEGVRELAFRLGAALSELRNQ